MLKRFIDNSSNIEEIRAILDLINALKENLSECNFSISHDIKKALSIKFSELKEKAEEINNEDLINCIYIGNIYSDLYLRLESFFKKLYDKEFKNSWLILQDCLDSCYYIGKYTDIENRYEVQKITQLLVSYEKLYPYNLFVSLEAIVTDSTCSICGEKWNSLSCIHRKGKLYRGKPAYEIINNMSFSALALVEHPLDKKCIIEPEDTNWDEAFKKLDLLLGQNMHPLTIFESETVLERKKRTDIIIVGRNELCSCNSGKKFKKCCGKNLYYENYHTIIKPIEKIDFFIL